MKKFTALLLVLLLTLCVSACSPTPTETPVPTESPKPADLNASVSVKCGEYDSYDFEWTKTDDTTAKLELSETMVAPEEILEQLGYDGSLTMKDIKIYDLTYTKDENGVFTAEGNVTSVKMILEGECAEEFKTSMKESLGDSKLDEMHGRLLDGEILTVKEDIENYTWRFDEKIKLTFTINDGKLVIDTYEEIYTEWGTLSAIRAVFTVENNVRATLLRYENGELVETVEFDDIGGYPIIE